MVGWHAYFCFCLEAMLMPLLTAIGFQVHAASIKRSALHRINCCSATIPSSNMFAAAQQQSRTQSTFLLGSKIGSKSMWVYDDHENSSRKIRRNLYTVKSIITQYWQSEIEKPKCVSTSTATKMTTLPRLVIAKFASACRVPKPEASDVLNRAKLCFELSTQV